MGPQYKTYVYDCSTMHYKYSTYVKAKSVKEARQLGYLEAKKIMGGHARISSDTVTELCISPILKK